MTFLEYYNRLIMEMPHISLHIPGGNPSETLDFDPEFEHCKTLDDLKSHLNRILSGKKITTVRGHTYFLPSSLRQIFLDDIKDYLSMYINFKYHSSMDDDLYFIKLFNLSTPSNLTSKVV